MTNSYNVVIENIIGVVLVIKSPNYSTILHTMDLKALKVKHFILSLCGKLVRVHIS